MEAGQAETKIRKKYAKFISTSVIFIDYKATKTIVTTEEQTSATIEVTAQDGTQENYTVTLVRNSSNNILESISAKGFILILQIMNNILI